ncbi:AraC family transcriptional regulator [Zavarzinia compransoris]|uniref:AraC family transcriptional regulator n=1 Tax=Zavarzinia marina TaxID=2911065 RepID=UPI001F160EF3|nr:AraC family transcriptional regulator [Zavarzinia marina]MCF4167112.1 AraC family transcriptional regulator [Zavarzinia marina]
MTAADHDRLDRPLAGGETARFFRAAPALAVECLAARFHTYAYAPHTHDEYVIGTVIAGQERFSIGIDRGFAGPGDLFLIEPGTVHDGAPGPGGYAYRIAYPAPALLAAIAGDVAERAGAAPRFGAFLVHDPALAARLAQVHRAAEAGADPLAAEEGMFAVLATVMARHGVDGALRAGLARPAGQETVAVTRVTDFLDAHYAEAPDLATLSRIAGLPRARLIRAMRRATGLTPHAWLNDRRVRAARRLLAAGGAPAEVAAACGFCDQSHLNRAFKARVGIAPGAYGRLYAN